MNKVRIIFPFVLLFFITLAGQEKTSILNCSYYNGITNKEQFVETIEIQNLSSKDLLTFIVKDDSMSIKNKEAIFRYYFLKQRDGFSWIEYSLKSTYVADNSIIGYTFLVKIPPKKSFRYNILKNDTTPSQYRSKIVCIDRCHVEKMLDMQLDSTLFYEQEFITLQN